LTLEFDKVADQVRKMGQFLAKRTLTQSDRLEIALERYLAATDLEAIQERIKLVRQSNISGYRGAAPFDESIPERFDSPPMPTEGTVIAADGSQIYPDHHAAALYYLTNIGIFVYYYGEDRLPEQITEPHLHYTDKFLLDDSDNLINNATVNARRSVGEMQALARMAWDLRGEARPLVTLYDGPLLKFFLGGEVVDSVRLMNDYRQALNGLHDVGATLVGYIDVPDSRFVIKLLHLMSLDADNLNEHTLGNDGDLQGLTDKQLFQLVLQPGQRSSVMIQNSPTNRDYQRNFGEDYGVAFFYINASQVNRPVIARIDLPFWVARHKPLVDSLQASVLAQCAIQAKYPYALTRADELAVISVGEKMELDEMIAIEMLQNQVEGEQSAKLDAKNFARANKQQHRLKT